MIEFTINDTVVKTTETKVDSIQLIINGVTYYDYRASYDDKTSYIPEFKITEGDTMSTEERWVHIAKLEANNRASKEKSDTLNREHEREMQRMANVSQSAGIAMSIFNPFILLSSVPPRDKKNDKGDL
tara:strand:- start:1039 stop:1422 length:384 start_codon:yes stop_codon:yes gene_type:complete